MYYACVPRGNLAGEIGKTVRAEDRKKRHKVLSPENDSHCTCDLTVATVACTRRSVNSQLWIKEKLKWPHAYLLNYWLLTDLEAGQSFPSVIYHDALMVSDM